MVPLFLFLLVRIGASIPHPTSAGEVCEPVPCENGGDCPSTPADESVTSSGWEERSVIGPCRPNPCHNQGVCELSETYRGDTFVGYLCRCPLGFDGVHCQHNVNECEKNPCKNGGSCTDLRANYTCQCPGEYMGRNCQYKCSGPLGMEGGIISNQQVTASSTHRALFGLQKWFPYFARLNKKGLVNAWSAAEGDRYPWIQINLQRRMRVTGLITQGAKRIGSPEYVKSYKVAYSDDGKAWSMFKVKDTDEDVIFTGNTDNNSPSANSFSPPIEAQYIRIYPQVCRKHCTLRMELLGCELTGLSFEACSIFIANSVMRIMFTLAIVFSGCSEPIGMKTGHIQDYQITSSSVFQTLNMDMFSWEPSKARLDKQGKVNAWTSAHSDQSQWLQVDLLITTKITGIITQGAKDFGHVQFVGSYKVAFSNDGEKWFIYQDEKQQKDKIFQGNFDNETHRKNVLDPPIYARFIRILPWSWYGRITMRVELLGCPEEL
ncbi:EGF-like repeat and discoidin I-like domain-containing protein 3 isoform X2 [Labeo rohita]|uniref:EGF-like repeat and discoidin I-like domain-containing protein 3 isoform X2 n=1 Tax=Labeo rohita TaxID=84645 RepID=UPI0021E299FB|nr:EGF-like repeat and discoidin I-like domain-containing protein 3 isoform X2 [Labeo rohita]